VSVYEYCGGSLELPGLTKRVLERAGKANNPTDLDKEMASQEAKERFKACLFFSGANRERFGKLQTNTANNYLQGNDGYPKTVIEAMGILNNWENPDKEGPKITGTGGLNFANVSEQEDEEKQRETGTTLATRGKRNDKSDITCFHCGETGHYANECPHKQETKNKQQGT
jgi:hypothetical protein